MNTKQLVEGLDIRVEVREHMLSAIAGRGKTAGYLCATRPKDPARAAAWLAIMVNICPRWVSVGSIVMLGRERRIFEEVDAIARIIPVFILGAEKPYRWAIDTPHLSACRVSLEKDGGAVVSAINGWLKKLGVR